MLTGVTLMWARLMLALMNLVLAGLMLLLLLLLWLLLLPCLLLLLAWMWNVTMGWWSTVMLTPVWHLRLVALVVVAAFSAGFIQGSLVISAV